MGAAGASLDKTNAGDPSARAGSWPKIGKPPSTEPAAPGNHSYRAEAMATTTHGHSRADQATSYDSDKTTGIITAAALHGASFCSGGSTGAGDGESPPVVSSRSSGTYSATERR